MEAAVMVLFALLQIYTIPYRALLIERPLHNTEQALRNILFRDHPRRNRAFLEVVRSG